MRKIKVTPEIDGDRITITNQKYDCLMKWDSLCRAKREHIKENNELDAFIKMRFPDISEETLNKLSLHIQQYGNKSGNYTKLDIVYLVMQINLHLIQAMGTATDHNTILSISRALNDLDKIVKITEVL